jgi:phenylalanyl-tRNA synthetase alpha chain
MNEIQTQIGGLRNQFNSDLKVTTDLDALYLKYFSKKNGIVTQLLKELPTFSAEDKKVLGPALNGLKRELEDLLEQEKKSRKQEMYNDPMIDMSFPLKSLPSGMLHPTTQIIRMMNQFFRYYGFSIIEGPEIETEEYNFRKLNLPEGHPATDLQDTLYISEKDGILLRTHTSSIESRILTNQTPPIRAVVGGKCYRNETLNATNGAFFWQYQGVVVDKGITMQNLKATLEAFHKFLFGEDVKLRFRYKYYPEVSPGMGVDMQCRFCAGSGCEVCKHRGWIEVLGSGMIHYNTLKMCGIDPNVYTGYAFGMGLDRLVMQKFGINDIRKLYEGGLVYK